MTAHDWGALGRLIEPLDAGDGTEPPHVVSGTDQIAKLARDTLGSLGLNIDDPDVLYAVASTLLLGTVVAQQSEERGTLSFDAAVEVCAVLRAIGGSIRHLVPEDGRRA